MNRLLFAFLVVFLSGFAQRASAQHTVHYDSLAVDSIVGSAGVDQEMSVMGHPDGLIAHFAPSGFMGVQFIVNGQPVDLHKGAELHFYWQKKQADSSVGDIQFVRLDAQQHPLIWGPIVRLNEAGPLNTERMRTIIVPDTDQNGMPTSASYNDLSISVAADPDVNATSFWLDAIELIQPGEASVFRATSAPLAHYLENYPNPFVSTSGTTIHVAAEEAGSYDLVVTDLLGREVAVLKVGSLGSGSVEVPFSAGRPGVYVARLRHDGAFVGAPLKVTAE